VADILVYPPLFFFLLLFHTLNLFFKWFYSHMLIENRGENKVVCPSIMAMKEVHVFWKFLM
jgi:hypothetical protein